MLKNFKFIILFIFLLFIFCKFKNKKIENMENYNKKLYNNLKKNFNNIFPDNNRNSGGAQFFYFILKHIKPNKKDFDIYNTLYCSVSGSLIDPDRKYKSDKVTIKDINNKNICGTYYRCCTPCNCDIMKYSRVEKMNITLSDGIFSYYVISINDPCLKQNKIPKQVTSFKCYNNKTKNAFHSPSGRIVIGILHNSKECTNNDLIYIKNNNNTGESCRKRNSMNVNELKYGMGDIFIKLSTI